MGGTRTVEILWEVFFPGVHITRSARRLTIYSGGTRHTFTRDGSDWSVRADFQLTREMWQRARVDAVWWQRLKELRAVQACAENVIFADECEASLPLIERGTAGVFSPRGQATAAREIFNGAGSGRRECDGRGAEHTPASGVNADRKIATMTTLNLTQRRPVKKVVEFDRESNGRCYWKLSIDTGGELLPFGHWVTFTRAEMPLFAESQGWELRGEPEQTEPAEPVHKGCPND